jgi:hypothetical protein
MRLKARIGLGAIVVGLLFVGIHPQSVTDRIVAYQEWRDDLGAIDVSDGIQQGEADLIARRYEHSMVGTWSSCSGTATPILVDRTWRAQMLFGYGGEPTGQWITVDAISGGVTSPRGGTYATLASFRRAALVRAILSGR